jgi:hypothetical protein
MGWISSFFLWVVSWQAWRDARSELDGWMDAISRSFAAVALPPVWLVRSLAVDIPCPPPSFHRFFHSLPLFPSNHSTPNHHAKVASSLPPSKASLRFFLHRASRVTRAFFIDSVCQPLHLHPFLATLTRPPPPPPQPPQWESRYTARRPRPRPTPCYHPPRTASGDAPANAARKRFWTFCAIRTRARRSGNASPRRSGANSTLRPGARRCFCPCPSRQDSPALTPLLLLHTRRPRRRRRLLRASRMRDPAQRMKGLLPTRDGRRLRLPRRLCTRMPLMALEIGNAR